MSQKNKKSSAVLPVILSVGMCATTVGAAVAATTPTSAYAASAIGSQTQSNAQKTSGTPKDTQAPAAAYPTVTFKNGDSTIATVQVKKGNSTGSDTPSDIKDTGHIFLGWSTENNATAANFWDKTPVTTNTTVYAVFKKDKDDPAQKASVTFNIDGANVNTMRVEKGKTLGNRMPAQPTKTGYEFLGWSTTEGASEKTQVNFTSATTVSANTTVYAVFKRQIVMQTVTFKSNNDSSVIQVEKGEKVTSTPSAVAPDGYRFVGWSAKQDGTGPKFDFTKRITQDITVYAIFKTEPGVIDIVPDPIPPDRPILPPNPGGHIPDPDDPLNPGGGSTQKYSVTFKNGDTVISTVNVERGETVKSTDMPKNLQRDGYTFLGWSTEKDASDEDDVDFKSTTQVYENKTVYAVFQIIPVVLRDVTFKNDDAWLSTYYVKQNETLDSSKFPASPSKSGYKFVGWSTQKNATDADFSSTKAISADTTVYAVFKANPYETSHDVVFESDGAWIKTVQVEDQKTVTDADMPTDPSKSGYKFVGWSTQKNATDADFSSTKAISADTTVYAVFKKDEHPTKTEVLIGKMTYTGSSDLTFKSTNKKSDPVDGKKVTDGSGKVTLNTPATDGVTEVGNKETTYEDITPGTTYQADSSLAYNTTKETAGTKGTRKIEKFYGVDSTTGVIGTLDASNSEIIQKATNKVIKVGNKKVTTVEVEPGTTYEADSTLDYGKTSEIAGEAGTKSVTTVYKVDKNTGLTTDVDGTPTEVITKAAKDKVIKVGNKKVTTVEVEPGTTYEADSSLDYNKTSEIAGEAGTKSVTKVYKVNKDTGLTTELDGTPTEVITKAAKNKVIKVGNVDTKTTEIQFKKIEKNDASLKKGERKVQTQGKNGSDVVITTYVVDPETGLTNAVESVRGKHIDAVDKVVLVGTKEDLTPTPTPEPPVPPTPEPPTPAEQHDSSAPAVMDTQEAEVLPGKMKYEADDTLPFNTQKKISDPVEGLKVTTHTGKFVNGKWEPSEKVEITDAKDGLTKVGNKQVTHDGDKTITTTYDVDPDTGELTNPQTHTSMPASTLTPAHTTPSTPSTPNLMPTPTPVPSTPGLISAPTSTPINPSADLHQPKHMHERVTPKTGESSSLASLWSIIGLPITALGILYKKKNKKQDK